MITLYTLPPAFGLRNVSPFCLKAEMALTYLKLDFELVEEGDPRKTPRGKLPYLVVDGEPLPDSELIFEYLDRRSEGGLFGGLTPLEMALGTAFTRLADDHLYWIGVASRWLEDDWFEHVRQGFFGDMPWPLRAIVPAIARRQVRKTYYLHGLGRHSRAEQEQFARRDLQAIASVVEAQDYIVGGRLTAFDFSVAGMLVGFLENQPATWLTHVMEDYPALRDYTERVQSGVGVYGRYT